MQPSEEQSCLNMNPSHCLRGLWPRLLSLPPTSPPRVLHGAVCRLPVSPADNHVCFWRGSPEITHVRREVVDSLGIQGKGRARGGLQGPARMWKKELGKGASLSLPSPARVLQNEVPGEQFKGKTGKLNGWIFHPLRSSHWCLNKPAWLNTPCSVENSP